jgi:4-amino-4-deoxy-L-arabinose transferase-like glycosyltransferase
VEDLANCHTLLCLFGISLLGLSLLWSVALISKISQKQNPNNFFQTKFPIQLALCCSTLGLFAMLIPVTIWSLTPIIYGGNKGLPFAGPDLQTAISSYEIPDWTRLTNYLYTHRTTEKYLLGTDNAQNASPFILSTGDAIMAMSGFTGNDPILTTEEIKQKVEEKEIRFFLIPGEPNNNFQNQT